MIHLFTVSGLHYVYGALARAVPGASASAVMKKIAFDQIFVAPCIVSSFFWIVSALEGKNFQEIKTKYFEVIFYSVTLF